MANVVANGGNRWQTLASLEAVALGCSLVVSKVETGPGASRTRSRKFGGFEPGRQGVEFAGGVGAGGSERRETNVRRGKSGGKGSGKRWQPVANAS